MSPFSIIILTMNSIGRTISTISSVRRAILNLSAEIIIVDNGSTDGVREWLAVQPDIRLIANTSNLGVPRARNLGIKAAKNDLILFLDNDVDLKPHALPLFAERLSHPHCGLVGDAGSIMIPEWMWGNIRSHDSSDGDFPGVNFIVGYCMATRRDVLAKVGPFDEGYPPYYWEDVDYAIRIRKAGYDLAVVSDTCFHHRRATVVSANSIDQILDVEWEGRTRTLQKHGRDCPAWVLADGGSNDNLPELEGRLARIRQNLILHVISPDLSVEERRPWRVVLPGEMYPRDSYSRICHWTNGWDVGPLRVPVRDHEIAELNDPIDRRPW